VDCPQTQDENFCGKSPLSLFHAFKEEIVFLCNVSLENFAYLHELGVFFSYQVTIILNGSFYLVKMFYFLVLSKATSL
jgi:hypothetical protein